jgi:hypothetical protein
LRGAAELVQAESSSEPEAGTFTAMNHPQLLPIAVPIAVLLGVVAVPIAAFAVALRLKRRRSPAPVWIFGMCASGAALATLVGTAVSIAHSFNRPSSDPAGASHKAHRLGESIAQAMNSFGPWFALAMALTVGWSVYVFASRQRQKERR